MGKETQINKVILAEGLFDALDALYTSAADLNPPDLAVVSVVRGYMLAYLTQANEEAAPAKPKQRRARRKKADMVALAAEAINA